MNRNERWEFKYIQFSSATFRADVQIFRFTYL